MPQMFRKQIAPGLKLTWTNENDIWLHAESMTGYQGAIALKDIMFPIAREAFQGWAETFITEPELLDHKSSNQRRA